MKEYVIGFLFKRDKKLETVALIQKKRPDWQIGKLNGIGGHIEVGETPLQAMAREFNEEAGIFLNDWEYFCTMIYPEAKIYCFRNWGDYKVTTKTDEVIDWYPVYPLPDNVIANINWLIPMAHYIESYISQIVFNFKENSHE